MGISEISAGIIVVILCIQSYWDIRYKEIPLAVSVAGGMTGVILFVLAERNIKDVMFALLPGAVCLLLGKVSREAIGYGDGILLCVMGLFFAIEELLAICMTAFILAGICALILFVVFHKKGNYEMPFVPFLLAACVVEYFLGNGV